MGATSPIRVFWGTLGLLWGSQFAFDKGFESSAEPPEPPFKGTLRSARTSGMPWKQWNRVYTRATASTGVTLLLVEKLRAAANDTQWVAVDPAKRCVVIDVGQQELYRPRPVRGITYQDPPGLSSADKVSAKETAFKMIHRATGVPKQDGEPIKQENGRPRARALWGYVGHLLELFAFAWSRRFMGVWASMIFLVWRVWLYFGVGEKFFWIYGTVKDTVITVEYIKDFSRS